MCTRFSNTLTLEAVDAVFAALADLARPPPPPNDLFALGQEVAVVASAGGRRTVTARRWGWRKADGGLLANARIETAATKRYFAAHADARRCVLPPPVSLSRPPAATGVPPGSSR